MKKHQFQVQAPSVKSNPKLRKPQRDGFTEIEKHFRKTGADREIGLILPVGCGKSGLIAIAPFAIKARRAFPVPQAG